MLALVLPVLAVGSAGCADYGWGPNSVSDSQLEDPAIVSLFVTHHATAGESGSSDGDFPPHEGPPVFETDLGWEVLLDEAYLTTSNISLVACETGEEVSVDAYWGSVPEDLTAPAGETFPFGGAILPDATWCWILVRYGPFFSGGADDYQAPSPELEGRSVWIRGLAQKGALQVPFEVAVESTIEVSISIDELDEGQPLDSSDGSRPDLTIDKNYAHLFDGVDFEDGSVDDAALVASLAANTQAFLGTERPD
jgi:hypothetical protein